MSLKGRVVRSGEPVMSCGASARMSLCVAQTRAKQKRSHRGRRHYAQKHKHKHKRTRHRRADQCKGRMRRGE
eukprot:567-Rhodomonas_salina.2